MALHHRLSLGAQAPSEGTKRQQQGAPIPSPFERR